MRRLFVSMIILACAPFTRAQSSCSFVDQNAAVAQVAALRTQLRSTQLPLDVGTDLSVGTQGNIANLKIALAKAANAFVACDTISQPPSRIESGLAMLLHANAPQPAPGASIMTGDPRYLEALSLAYSSNLLVSVRKLSPSLLGVNFRFHIPCGDDNVLIIFEAQLDHWMQRLVWQASPYKDISFAFGDVYEYVALSGEDGRDWKVVVVHGHPWCTSRFSSFDIDILAPAVDPNHPRIVWHTSREYSRGDFPARLTAAGNAFELRINAAAFVPEEYERTVIYHYRLDNDRVQRGGPIAVNGRGFVDEWLEAPWDEASQFATDDEKDAFKTLHHSYHASQQQSGASFVSYANGPVSACIAPGIYQVQLDAERETIVPGKPGGSKTTLPSTYFFIQRVGDGYLLLSTTTQSKSDCHGPNLMKKP